MSWLSNPNTIIRRSNVTTVNVSELEASREVKSVCIMVLVLKPHNKKRSIGTGEPYTPFMSFPWPIAIRASTSEESAITAHIVVATC
jgi:hypothetical protein